VCWILGAAVFQANSWVSPWGGAGAALCVERGADFAQEKPCAVHHLRARLVSISWMIRLPITTASATSANGARRGRIADAKAHAHRHAHMRTDARQHGLHGAGVQVPAPVTPLSDT
jgi:hypothetical protein